MAADGSVHEVRIEWIGNRLRRAPADLRRRMRRTAESGEALEFVEPVGDGVVGLVVGLLVGIVLVVLVAPLLIGLVEAVVVIVIGGLLWSFRVLFGRPWKVVHRRGEAVIEEDLVDGWRAAHHRMVETAEGISRVGHRREACHPSSAEALPPLPVFGGTGVMPGVDLADFVELRKLVDDGREVDPQS